MKACRVFPLLLLVVSLSSGCATCGRSPASNSDTSATDHSKYPIWQQVLYGFLWFGMTGVYSYAESNTYVQSR